MPTSLHLKGDQSLKYWTRGQKKTFSRVRRQQQIFCASLLNTAWKDRVPSFPQPPGSQENLKVKFSKTERKTTHSIRLSILILSRKETVPLSANAEFLHWAQAQDCMCKEGGKLETTHLLPLVIYQILEYFILIDIFPHYAKLVFRTFSIAYFSLFMWDSKRGKWEKKKSWKFLCASSFSGREKIMLMAIFFLRTIAGLELQLSSAILNISSVDL